MKFLFFFLEKSGKLSVKHDIYVKSKSYELDLLKELIVYHNFRSWSKRRSWV